MSRANSVRAARAAAPETALRGATASFARAVEGVQAAALAGVRHDGELVRDEVRDARSLREVGELGWAWASEEWTRAGLAAAGLFNALLDLQSWWWHAAEAMARAGLSPLLGDATRPVAWPPLFEWPLDPSAGAAARRIADTWQALGGAWLSAIDHDLEPGKPA